MNSDNKYDNETEAKNLVLTSKVFMSYRVSNPSYFQKDYPWGDFAQILRRFKETCPVKINSNNRNSIK